MKIRKMHRKWLVWLLLLAMLFTGCGKSSEISEETSETVSVSSEVSEVTETPTPTSTPTPKPTNTPTATPTPTATVTPTPGPTPQGGDMGVHFLDVGQGTSILVQSGGQNLIYDGGGRSSSSFVVSYLRKQNIDTIDYLIASHYDEDHIAGLVGCLNAFTVKNVIGPNDDKDTKIYQSFLNGVSAQGLSVHYPSVGEEYTFGTGSFSVLAPASISSSDDNANSVVIKLQNGNNSFIFTGDADSNSESAMCASGMDLSCDVLAIAHHGSATATSWGFLEKTVPAFAVISCGANNSYGHPAQDTMDKLASMGIDIFRTDKQGTIIALSDGTDITWDQSPCNDYTPGDSSDSGTQPQQSAPELTQAATDTGGGMVWIPASGEKYHSIPNCGRMNPDKATQMSKSQAESSGYKPCSKCW